MIENVEDYEKKELELIEIRNRLFEINKSEESTSIKEVSILRNKGRELAIELKGFLDSVFK